MIYGEEDHLYRENRKKEPEQLSRSGATAEKFMHARRRYRSARQKHTTSG
jgi:hypothetical protein